MLIRLSNEEIINAISIPQESDTPNTDEMAIPSYLHSNPLIRWLMWRRLKYSVELAQLKPDNTVLDFGCGIGLLLPTLHRLTSRVYAVDLYPKFAQVLASTSGLDVTFVEDVEEIEDNSLDVIIATDVLEHIDNLGPYLDLFHRKLARNGKLVVSGPTENLVYRLGRILIGWRDKGDYHVSNIYEVDSTIRNRGFTRIANRSIPFAMPPHLFCVFGYIHHLQ